MSQNPFSHKTGGMVWIGILFWVLVLGVGCKEGSDDGKAASSLSEPVKLMDAQTNSVPEETPQPDTTATEGEAEPVAKPTKMPLKQVVSKTSQEVLTAVSERFGKQERLLFLHSAYPENGYVVVGFPGRLLVAPDTSPLAQVLVNQPPRITVKVHPDAIASIIANMDQPSVAIMDSSDTLVGLIATEKTMLRLRRSAVVVAPQPSGNEAAREAAKAILKPASSKEAPQGTAHPPEAKDSVDTVATPGKASETVSPVAVSEETKAAHEPEGESAGTEATTQHQTETAATHATAPATTPPKEGGHGAPVPAFDDQMPTGIAFIDSAVRPMTFELKDRFWGWRPNDLARITDNVNHFQLGVLEVTRRTAVVLAQRISRTGITAAFDPNLEKAMNWFMIKADRFWLPSAESKYRDGLEEWSAYRERLLKDEAAFYNRADNLIPLLTAYEDLLGSCEENLVKVAEEDGTPVSYFSSDNYFFYTQGVISAMVTILEAVGYDFKEILSSRRADEDLHHAISSCEYALEINPIVVFNNAPSSVFANHRANLAAPVSHARFFLSVLIKTLST